MRLSIQLILIFVLFGYVSHSQTDLYSKPFSSTKNEWQLGELLKEIRLQSGLDLTYSGSQLDLSQKILIPAGKINVGQCFDLIETNASVRMVWQGRKILLLKNFISSPGRTRENSLSGFVRDASTGEYLIGANILIMPGATGTISDLNGYFYVGLNGGETDQKAVISYVGYGELVIDLRSNTPLQSDFYLKHGEEITPVIIYDRQQSIPEMQMPFSAGRNQTKVRFLPGSMGGIDLFRELALMPGVLKSTDLQSGLAIRGFGNAHTHYLVDGIHLYEPNHSFGLFSVFNHQAVNHADLFKHDVPPEFSGRLSGVVNNELRNGNLHAWETNIGLNSSAMDVTLNGPISKGSTALMISARKSLIDAYLPAIAKRFSQFENSSVDFYDFNIKISHRINPRNLIEIMTLQYEDRVQFTYLDGPQILKNQVEWGSNLGGIKWTGVFGDKLSLSSQFAWSNYSNFKNAKQFVLVAENDTVRNNILGQSQIKDVILHIRAKYYFGNDLQLNTGVKTTLHRLRPSLYRRISYDIEDLTSFLESGQDSSLVAAEIYSDLNYKWTDQIGFGGGLQYLALIYPYGELKNFLNPVFRIRYQPVKNHLFHVSIQKFVQSQHLLLQNTYGLSSDFWLPASRVLPAQQMWQSSIDYSWQISENILYQAGAYLRAAKGLPAFKNPGDQYDPVLDRGIILPVFTDSGNWEGKVISHRAFSRGLEQELNWKSRFLTMVAAYTLAKTDYIEDQNDLKSIYPGDFDVRHTGSLLVRYTPVDKFSCYTSWQYHSGRPVSLALNSYLNSEGNWVLDYGLKNAYRIAPYQSLDAGIYGKWVSKGYIFDYALGLTNILNHKNPIATKLYLDEDQFEVRQISGFQCLPYIRFNLFIQ